MMNGRTLVNDTVSRATSSSRSRRCRRADTIALTARTPNPGTRNSPGVVFELNLLGYDDGFEAGH